MRRLQLILMIALTLSVTTLSAKDIERGIDVVAVSDVDMSVAETEGSDSDSEINVAAVSEIETLKKDKSDEPITAEEIERSIFLPHIGRVDRDINKRIFAYKGEVVIGATASYMTLNSDNLSLLLMVNDIDIESMILAVSPSAGYFYRDNKSVGGRFKYSKIDVSVNSAQIDLGETNGIEFDIPEVSVFNESYTYALYHRTYTAIDPAGHFGIFAEAELSYTKGLSRLGYSSDGEWVSSLNKSNCYSLNFNPGISAFVLNNVCATVSLQFGGVNFYNIRQYDANNQLVGTRDSSQMKFKINLLAINIGVTGHLWQK